MSDCIFTSQVESLGFYFLIVEKSLRQYINHIPYEIMQAIFVVFNWTWTKIGAREEYSGVQSCEVKHNNSGEVTAIFMTCKE